MITEQDFVNILTMIQCYAQNNSKSVVYLIIMAVASENVPLDMCAWQRFRLVYTFT